MPATAPEGGQSFSSLGRSELICNTLGRGRDALQRARAAEDVCPRGGLAVGECDVANAPTVT